MSNEFGKLEKVYSKMWYPTKTYEQKLKISLVSY